VAESGLLQQS